MQGWQYTFTAPLPKSLVNNDANGQSTGAKQKDPVLHELLFARLQEWWAYAEPPEHMPMAGRGVLLSGGDQGSRPW